MTDDSSTTTYTWNVRNQLTGITAPGVAATFTYDSVGRRTGKTIQGVTTNDVYDGLNPVQEQSGSTVTATLLTGLGIDEVFTRTDGSGTNALLPDALGSTVALDDGTGALPTQYRYEPFGYATQSGAASSNSYTYTSREDDGTGLYYYRARYYHPRLQRFISEDPLGFEAGDTNLYVYVFNNPTNLTDPTGEIAPLIAACLRGVAQGALPDLLQSVAKRKLPTIDGKQAAADCLTGGLNKATTALRAVGNAAKPADKFRRTPNNLMDQMVLDAAKRGAGKRIIHNLGDPKFKGMDKWSYGETSANGLRSEVHYVRDPATGQLMDFKFPH